MIDARSRAASLVFGTTPLKSNGKHIAINHLQFLQSLADNLRQRLLTSESSESARVTAGKAPPSAESNKLIIAQLAVMSPDYWPSEIDVSYGETELRFLCQRFRLPYVTVRDAFSDFKDSGGRRIPKHFKLLTSAVNTIPASTAECERGFSAMNVIRTVVVTFNSECVWFTVHQDTRTAACHLEA